MGLAQARPNNISDGRVRQHMKHKQMGAGSPSVQSPPAIGCAAETRNLFILDGKLVVIGDLLPQLNVSLGVNNNLLLRAKTDDLSITVWLRREGGREGGRERAGVS